MLCCGIMYMTWYDWWPMLLMLCGSEMSELYFHFVNIYDYPCEGCIVYVKKLIDIFILHRWLRSECRSQSGVVLCMSNV